MATEETARVVSVAAAAPALIAEVKRLQHEAAESEQQTVEDNAVHDSMVRKLRAEVERLRGALRGIRKTHADHEDRCDWCGKTWPCSDYAEADAALAAALK